MGPGPAGGLAGGGPQCADKPDSPVGVPAAAGRRRPQCAVPVPSHGEKRTEGGVGRRTKNSKSAGISATEIPALFGLCFAPFLLACSVPSGKILRQNIASERLPYAGSRPIS